MARFLVIRFLMMTTYVIIEITRTSNHQNSEFSDEEEDITQPTVIPGKAAEQFNVFKSILRIRTFCIFEQGPVSFCLDK